MTKLTYTQNRLTGQYIIQLIIDKEDLTLPRLVPIAQRGMSVPEQLTYLSQLTAAIDAALTDEENTPMIDSIFSRDEDEGPIDLPDDDAPAWDEDEMERDYDDSDDPGQSEEDYIPSIDDPEEISDEERKEQDEEELE